MSAGRAVVRRVDGHPLRLTRPRSQGLGGQVEGLVGEIDEALELAALGAEPVEVDVGRVPALDEPLGARDRLVDLIAHLEQEPANGLGRDRPPVRLLHAERDLGALDVDAGLRRPDAVLGGDAGVLDEAPREDRLDDADRASHEGAGDVRRVLVVGGGDLVAAGPGRGTHHGLDLDLRAADPEGLELLAPVAFHLGDRLPGLRAPAERGPEARVQGHPDGRGGRWRGWLRERRRDRAWDRGGRRLPRGRRGRRALRRDRPGGEHRAQQRSQSQEPHPDGRARAGPFGRDAGRGKAAQAHDTTPCRIRTSRSTPRCRRALRPR